MVQAAAPPACVKLVSERPDAAESSIEDDAPQVWERGAIRRGGVRRRCVERSSLDHDQGAPVSTYTVAREIGHGGEAIVRRVYGHLGQVRHRAEAVEYRVERHAAKL